MKSLKFLKKAGLKLWQDESGQGTAEYALILVAVVGVAFLFKDKIRGVMENKLGELGSDIMSFKKN